jgi:UDP:flavonoid glycosyltransferase YjiC (YdhE family)
VSLLPTFLVRPLGKEPVRILFSTQAGSGHSRPLVPLPKALQGAGHDVAFATTPVACATIGVVGFRCFPVGIAEVISPEQRTPGVIREAVQTVMRNSHCRGNAEQLRDEMRATPDLNHAVALLKQLAVRHRRPCR